MLVGYNGTNTAVIEAPFFGTATVLAPRGTLEMGTASVHEVHGVVAAQNLIVRPDTSLVCVSSPQATKNRTAMIRQVLQWQVGDLSKPL